MNEATIAGTHHRINQHSSALYVHVDDVVVMGSSAEISDGILSHVVASLVQIGFVISQIVDSNEMSKTLGYDVNKLGKCLQFPLSKTALLQTAFHSRTNCKQNSRG